MKTKKTILLFFLVMTNWIVNAQIGINTSTPNPSAALDIVSSNKGLLPPRMTSANMTDIANPAEGLVVFCTDCSPTGLYLYNQSTWSNMSVGSTPDASSSVKGKIRLAGDLSGTASAPSIAGNAITTSKIATGAVTLAKLSAATGSENRILIGNASGSVSWQRAPFSEFYTVTGPSNVEIRGNGNWALEAFETAYLTTAVTLSKGVYMYINKNSVYHDVKSNASDVEGSVVSIETIFATGTGTVLSTAQIADAGVYKYALAGQVFMFEVTSATASLQFRYRPRVSDEIQNAFKMIGAFSGNIFKLY
jgi:hypothetical protein